MALAILHQIRCDEKGCVVIGVLTASSQQARKLAREAGWDVGPREIRNGIWEHTDYCPNHKRAGATVTIKER